MQSITVRKARLIVLLSLVVCGVCRADSLPTPEFLSVALARQGQASSLRATLTVTALGSGRVGWRATYVRTPALLYINRTDWRAVGSRQDALMETVRARYEPAKKLLTVLLTKADGSTHATVNSDSDGGNVLNTNLPMLDPYRHDLCWSPLYSRVAKGNVSAKESVGGHECYKVEMSIGVVSWTAWLDPSVGFCPRVIESRANYPKDSPLVRDGVTCVIDRYEYDGYVEYPGGVWFPSSLTIRYGAPDEGKGWNVEATSVEVGGAVDESETAVVIPPGTAVTLLPEGVDIVK